MQVLRFDHRLNINSKMKRIKPDIDKDDAFIPLFVILLFVFALSTKRNVRVSAAKILLLKNIVINKNKEKYEK